MSIQRSWQTSSGSLRLAPPPAGATPKHPPVYLAGPWVPFFLKGEGTIIPSQRKRAMTNENISGFLNSIAEAKRAFDAEPEYQRQIAELERDKQRLSETVAQRELRIHQLKQDQETLTQRLRSAEVERDDAGFRALEEADRVSALLTLVRGFVGDGLKAISAVEGQEQIVVSRTALDRDHDVLIEQRDHIVRVEGELQQLRDDMRLAQEQLTRPFAGATSSSSGDTTDPYFTPYEWPSDMPGQRVVDPTTAPTPSSAELQPEISASSVTSGSIEHPAIQEQTSFNHVPEGQSDGPFAKTVEPHVEPVSLTTAETATAAVLNASPPERNRDESTRFKGRKYYDVTYFVPLHEWLSKGGTREDYDWRPLPEANRASNFS